MDAKQVDSMKKTMLCKGIQLAKGSLSDGTMHFLFFEIGSTFIAFAERSVATFFQSAGSIQQF
jgi:hypothetical protein